MCSSTSFVALHSASLPLLSKYFQMLFKYTWHPCSGFILSTSLNSRNREEFTLVFHFFLLSSDWVESLYVTKTSEKEMKSYPASGYVLQGRWYLLIVTDFQVGRVDSAERHSKCQFKQREIIIAYNSNNINII